MAIIDFAQRITYMNILVDAHVFDDPHGGTRTYLKGLYGEMIRLMPESTFFMASYDIRILQNEFGDHANVVFIQLKKQKFLRLLFEIPFLVRKYKIDYAHFQYVSAPFKNCKHIVTTHDILFMDFADLFPLRYRVVKDFLFKFSARRADVLLTVSEYSKIQIAKHYKIPLRRIGLTPNGVSEDFRNADRAGDFSFRDKYKIDKFILFVSRVEPRKNHLMLLRAYRELELWEENYHLIFIGRRDLPYPEFDAYFESCPEECKRHTLHVLNVGNDELRICYKEARLFVYPSLAEGFGIPPLEAVLTGTDTLCSNQTAMAEFSFLGDDLFDPRNVEELKNKMIAKLSTVTSPERREWLKRYVVENYSWTSAARKMMERLRA